MTKKKHASTQKLRYLSKKIVGVTMFAGNGGNNNLLWKVSIEGLGHKPVKEDGKGRYVVINRKRYYLRKSNWTNKYSLYKGK